MLVRQCLHTSNFDFYRLDSRNFIRSENFQCPRTGNSHFYQVLSTISEPRESVNALVRATYISTEQFSPTSKTEESVNALVRATYISTDIRTVCKNGRKRNNLCQCPRTGNLHFY